MARCVYNPTFDTDDNVMRQACSVHVCYAPCPHDGEPASPVPVHVDERPSRLESIRWVSHQTGRARPIVVHRGSWADERQHQADVSGECWCGPTLIPADANPDDGEDRP